MSALRRVVVALASASLVASASLTPTQKRVVAVIIVGSVAATIAANN